MTEQHSQGERGEHGLGDTLLIHGEREAYSDLDEIFARYIEPMNDLVKQMVSSKFFRAGSKEEVDEWLRKEMTENPGRIPYAIRFYHKFPGYFILSWLLKKGSTVKNEVISVHSDVSATTFFDR